jgi:hypothetical protein
MSDRLAPRRRRFWRTLIAACLVAAAGGVVAWGFLQGRSEAAREAGQDHAGAQPDRVSVENGEPVVTLDAAAQREDEVKTTELKTAHYQDQVRATALVLDLQPLADLANAYARAKAQRQIAEAKLAASQTAFARTQKLYTDQHNMSAAQLQAAEAAFRVDQAGLADAESQVRTLALTAQQGWGPALAEALVGATAAFDRILAGQDALLQVTLWPGQALAQPPASAFAQLDDGSRVPLHFLSAATKTDPRIQGPSLLFTAPAGPGLLAGMSLVAYIAGDRTADGTLVPSAAIVWGQGRAWAYYRTGPARFARRPVTTDWPAPAGGYVVQGQPDGAEVVVQGAQLLFSEEFRSQLRGDD